VSVSAVLPVVVTNVLASRFGLSKTVVSVELIVRLWLKWL
jgi:hypothetical protein